MESPADAYILSIETAPILFPYRENSLRPEKMCYIVGMPWKLYELLCPGKLLLLLSKNENTKGNHHEELLLYFLEENPTHDFFSFLYSKHYKRRERKKSLNFPDMQSSSEEKAYTSFSSQGKTFQRFFPFFAAQLSAAGPTIKPYAFKKYIAYK